MEDLRKSVKNAGLSESVADFAMKELDRLEKTDPFLSMPLDSIILFQLWFFMAQKLPAVRNMFFQPVRRVFQVRKDDFFRF